MTLDAPGSPAARRRWRPVLAFVGLAYLLSWSWWLPLAFSGVVVDPGQGWPTHLVGLLGPAIAAVAVTAATEGKPGLAGLWSRIIRWRVSWAWFALIAITAALALLPVATGSETDAESLVTYSGAPRSGLWVVLYVLVVNGFGEEIGWRGYLAERLLERFSLGVTSLLVWVVWAGWHLPMFWVVGNFRDFGVGGTIGWVIGIGFGSGFLTWLYRSAGHSILIVALWHTAYNFTTATTATAGLTAAIATTVVMAVTGVVLCLPRTWWRPG